MFINIIIIAVLSYLFRKKQENGGNTSSESLKQSSLPAVESKQNVNNNVAKKSPSKEKTSNHAKKSHNSPLSIFKSKSKTSKTVEVQNSSVKEETSRSLTPDSDLFYQTNDLSTLVSRTFGGQLLNVYKCLKCKQQSVRVESFNDLALAFVDDEKRKSPSKFLKKKARKSDSATDNDGNGGKPTVAQLLDNYLQPETLTGDNKYRCDACASLQDAERSLRITSGPECLILTLLRFAYDAKAKKRTKIMQEVVYRKTLLVPVHSDVSTASSDTSGSHTPISNDSTCTYDVYGLCGVVVHSGLSSDAGHYYCYARHCKHRETPASDDRSDDVDYFEDRWFLFNDARVTFTSFSSFSDVTRRFVQDTPYLLFYTKLATGVRDDVMTVDPKQMTQDQLALRRDLLDSVIKDNLRFEQVKNYKTISHNSLCSSPKL